MPAFDKDTTPSGMGAISEALRTAGGAARSAHPQSSFAAIGPEADLLMADHSLECHLGPDSPLGKLYKMNARVLMIEVGYWAFTGFHLAEYLYTPGPAKAGVRVRRSPPPTAPAAGSEYNDVVLDDQKFEDIGRILGREPAPFRQRQGRPCASAAWCRCTPAVEFASGMDGGDRRDNRA